MIYVALYWGAMLLCYLIASKLRHNKDKFNWVGQATNIVVYIICTIMGLRMGSNEEVTSSLSTIGVQSLIVTVFCVGGSMFFVFLTRRMMKLGKDGGPITVGTDSAAEDSEDDKKNSNKDSLIFTIVVLVLVALGMALGYYVIPDTIGYERFEAMSSVWLTIGITVMLSFVGFSLGLSGEIIRSMKTVGFKVIWIPIAATLGSLVLGALYGLVSPLTVKEGVAIAAGFGWYTFAPGVIIDAGHAIAGAVSFMHNVIRETMGIILIPIAVQKIGALEATAIPGVAAMDVCVPIVERSVKHQEVIVYSFGTGFLMALTTAFLVPALMS